jgi:hypothetical protein
MPRILQVAFVIACIVVGTSAVSASDQIWQRAVAAYSTSQDWVPFEYEVEQQQFNGRDQLISHSITVSRLRPDGNGGWQPEIVRQDIIEGDSNQRSPFGGPEDREEGDTDEAERFAAVSASPLDPEMQDRISVSRVGRHHSPEGIPAILYRFEIRPNEGSRANGEVWLEADSGMPLRIERTVEPPMMAIKTFSAVQTYEPRPDHWLTTGMIFDVTGRLLFVERQVEINMKLRSHRHAPEVARMLQEQRARE